MCVGGSDDNLGNLFHKVFQESSAVHGKSCYSLGHHAGYSSPHPNPFQGRCTIEQHPSLCTVLLWYYTSLYILTRHRMLVQYTTRCVVIKSGFWHFFQKSFILCVCVRVCVHMHTLQSCGHQRTALWGRFSPSTFMWIPGIELRSPGLSGKHLVTNFKPSYWLMFAISISLDIIFFLCFGSLQNLPVLYKINHVVISCRHPTVQQNTNSFLPSGWMLLLTSGYSARPLTWLLVTTVQIHFHEVSILEDNIGRGSFEASLLVFGIGSHWLGPYQAGQATWPWKWGIYWSLAPQHWW